MKKVAILSAIAVALFIQSQAYAAVPHVTPVHNQENEESVQFPDGARLEKAGYKPSSSSSSYSAPARSSYTPAPSRSETPRYSAPTHQEAPRSQPVAQPTRQEPTRSEPQRPSAPVVSQPTRQETPRQQPSFQPSQQQASGRPNNRPTVTNVGPVREVRGKQVQSAELSNGGQRHTITDQSTGQRRIVDVHPDGSKKVQVKDSNGRVLESHTTRVNPRTGEKMTQSYHRDPVTGTATTIHPNGARTVISANGTVQHTRADGSSYVRERTPIGSGGYQVTHTEIRGGQRVTNTYVYNNYHSRSGVYVNVYAPNYGNYGYYYSPAYYGVYYSPWSTPYSYSWGYYHSYGWYSYCGLWCTPYPTYTAMNYWLVDYMLADMARVRYEERVARDNQVLAQQQQELNEQKKLEQELTDSREELAETRQELKKTEAQQAALSKEIKEELAQQAKLHMEAIKKQEPVTLDHVIDENGQVTQAGKSYNFTVHTEVNASEVATGEQCSLAEGDLIKVNGIDKDENGVAEEAANVIVVAAKGDDGCDVGSKIKISTTDLQEMINEYTQRLEKALEKAKEENTAGKIGAQVRQN